MREGGWEGGTFVVREHILDDMTLSHTCAEVWRVEGYLGGGGGGGGGA